jgi:S-adenosylmethionine hydrolase
MPAVVTLLTDFGTRDGFTAAMKGVILAIAPDADVQDAGHDVEPGDVEAGAWALSQYWNLYPAGTVHMAVVDPGVGGARKAIALGADGRFVVAPDNGLVTRVLQAADSWRCVEIAEPGYMRPVVSSTFHGRDVFAPAAAHLAKGVPLDRLGPPLSEPRLLDIPAPVRLEGEIRGRVAHIDRFGNLITDIPGRWVDPTWRVRVAGRDVGPLRKSYSEVGKGELLALLGSWGTVEIAAREGSAAGRVEAARGDPVTIAGPGDRARAGRR